MAQPEAVALRVVPVGEADLETVTGIVNRAFAKYSDLFAGPRTSAKEYADEAGPDARVIVAEAGGRAVATSMVAPGDAFVGNKSSLPGASSHPWIGALYYGLAGVEPAAMGGGLGQRMLECAESIARDEGFARVGLGTVREFGLVGYYERFGYQVLHEEEYPAGHWEFVVPHRYCEMAKAI